MAEVQGQTMGTDVVAKWRGPLEITALLLLAAILVSIVGGIVDSVFTPDASGWERLEFLGFSVVSIWHVAVLAVAVGLVFALRLPFSPDARGAAMARLALLDASAIGGVIAICALLGAVGTIGQTGEFESTVPEKIGVVMQFVGGGAVAAAAAVLALRGRSLLPAPVRPAPAPAAAPPTVAPAAAPGSPGWAADPYGRHQWRYWDGARWTDQVADGSTQSTDPAV
jgi:Protein of unknown function (DUF2510)